MQYTTHFFGGHRCNLGDLILWMSIVKARTMEHFIYPFSTSFTNSCKMIDLKSWLHNTNTNGKSLIEMRYYELSLLFTAINAYLKKINSSEWCLIKTAHLFLFINQIKFQFFEVSAGNWKTNFNLSKKLSNASAAKILAIWLLVWNA